MRGDRIRSGTAAARLDPLAAATDYFITQLSTRPNVAVPIMVIDKHQDDPTPVASVIVLTGGTGKLNLLTNWPTVRTDSS